MCKSNTEERDKDLYEAFKTIIDRSACPIRLMDILGQTVAHPAKRFYISSRRAFEVVTKIRDGEKVKMSSERSRMFAHLIKLIDDREKQHPGKPLKYIIEDVLDTPAPEFYLKPTSAK